MRLREKAYSLTTATMTQEILGSFLAQTSVGVAFEVMGPCENEKPQALGWEHSRIGNPSRVVSPLAKTARELYGRVIAGQKRRASCMRGGTFALSGQKPRASCAVGSQSRDRRHPRAEFPQFRMPLQRGVRARDSGPEENPSKIAVRARFLANWRGRREACTSGDSILEAVRSSRGCNEGDDGVVRGWEAQSREARAALVPLPGL